MTIIQRTISSPKKTEDNLKFKTKEELFNLHDSNLTNAVKSIFEVMKCQFKIFDRSSKYELQTKSYFVFAVTAFHHFIIANNISIVFYNRKKIFTESQMQTNSFL